MWVANFGINRRSDRHSNNINHNDYVKYFTTYSSSKVVELISIYNLSNHQKIIELSVKLNYLKLL
ncbi:hypothetical protein [Okeania sp. KiyG1]|uniref:hypothetical protein n=1 Tax=Okeania sp. KiyG1 TaxID=2720165 RepID=UPI001923E2F1|nr:hypothetical protein [Okeania sp. KiyG1]